MIVTCKICSNSIKVTPSHYERGAGKYCSIKCHAKARTIEGDRPCLQCKNIFKPHRQNLGWQKYCNAKCAGIGRSKRIIKNCIQCNKSYSFAPSQLNHYTGAGKYCSKKCHNNAVTLSKDAPPTDRYGRVESRKHGIEWKLAIRKKFDSICQRCGVYNQYIHTHHIASRSQRPDLIFDINNGITLCGSCHAWVHHHPEESVDNGWLTLERYEMTHSLRTTYNQ